MLLAAAVLPRPVAAEPSLAPLPARNLYPPRLVYLQPAPALAAPSTGVRLELAYGSVFVEDTRPRDSLLVDLEVARAAVVAAAATPWGGAVSVELPYLWFGGGAFDPLIVGYHDTFGFPDGGRTGGPRNAFAYEVRREDQGYSADPSAAGGLGDLVLELRQGAWESPSRAVRSAARLSLKLPTGSRRQGFGSGFTDAAVGLLAAWEAGRGGVVVNADAIYLGGEADPALRLEDRWSLAAELSAALRLGDRWAAVAQLHYATSPFGTGFSSLDDDAVLLAMGLRWRFATGAWATLGFTEDLAVEASPDISLLAAVEW